MEDGLLPTGFRFEPSDVEIFEYLHAKFSNPNLDMQVTYNIPILDVDIYRSLPDLLPVPFNIGSQIRENYYFVQRPKKRPARDVDRKGWWKTSAKKDFGQEFMRNQLNLFMYADENRSTRDTSNRTNWIMHEYTIPFIHGRENFALCKIYQKNEGAADDDDDDDD